MTDAMNCRRSEELWSDYREGTLPRDLEVSLAAHLANCADCAALHRAFEEVVSALHTLAVPEAPKDLSERLRRRAAAARREWPETPPASGLRLRASNWIAVAAVAALVLVWRPPEFAARGAREAYSFSVRAYKNAERYLEDLNLLRITVGVAFEDRIDRLNESLSSFSGTEREEAEAPDQSRRQETDPAHAGLIERKTPRSFL